MSTPVSAALPENPRLASLDAFRGLTILAMVFVNDVAGVSGTPAWLRHAPTHGDTMTFVDLVFPAFLFIVGMSIPFALERRLAREGPLKVQGQVLLRAAGLLFLGVMMVNLPQYEPDPGRPGKHLYTFLFYTAVILVWNLYPRSNGGTRSLFLGLRGLGTVLLVILVFLYQGRANGEVVGLRTQWWGILGLIGWAYVTAAGLYLGFRRNFAGVVGFIGVLVLMYVGSRGGAFAGFPLLTSYVDPGGQIGSHGVLTLSGVAVGMLFFPTSPAPSPRLRLQWMLGMGTILLVCGFWLRPLYGISKDLATPAWALISAACCCGLYAFLYWVIDLREWRAWARPLCPAGENPLLAYILPAWLLSGLGLVGFNLYQYTWNSYPLGVLRSLLFSIAILALTWALGRAGIRLRL